MENDPQKGIYSHTIPYFSTYYTMLQLTSYPSANVPYALESWESPEHWETKWQDQSLQELRQFSRSSLGAGERGMEQPGVI